MAKCTLLYGSKGNKQTKETKNKEDITILKQGGYPNEIIRETRVTSTDVVVLVVAVFVFVVAVNN